MIRGNHDVSLRASGRLLVFSCLLMVTFVGGPGLAQDGDGNHAGSGIELSGVADFDAPEWFIYDTNGEQVAREFRGEWKFVPLSPGYYTVSVKPSGSEVVWAEVQVVEGEVARLELSSGIELLGVPGFAAPEWFIYDTGGDQVAREFRGEWKFVTLPPGHYTVSLKPDRREIVWAELEVTENEVAMLEILSGVEMQQRAQEEPPETWYVYDGTGELLTEIGNRWGYTPLLPGDYQVASVLPKGENSKEVRWTAVTVSEGEVSRVDLNAATQARLLNGSPATYTLTGEFDNGTPVHLSTAGDELKLVDDPVPFDFIWVAASRRGTVIKIDTETGEIEGEYLSAPDGRGRDPSRTTVDVDGNAWAGNRAESADGKGSVVKVGLLENDQCVDRNGDGKIETSTGLADILPWTNEGGADDQGGVTTAEDECLILYTRVASTATRTVAVDENNDIWIGGNSSVHAKIDGRTGIQDPADEFGLRCGGYGGLVDGNGVLWSARYGGLLRFDTATSTGECFGSEVGNYGLAIDTTTGDIWHTKEVQDGVCKLDSGGVLLGCFQHGDTFAKGVAVDRHGNVWVAHGNLAGASPTVGRIRTDGTFVGNVDLLGGSGPTGVSVDANDKIWVTNISSDNVMRIDPLVGPAGGGGFPIGAVDLIVDLGPGAAPYNYSDMTGSAIAAVPDSGTWTVTHDGGTPGALWDFISWNAEDQTDDSITVTAATSTDGSVFSTHQVVMNGNKLDLPEGRYLRVEVRLVRLDSGLSPVLHDLTVVAREVARGPGSLRVVAADSAVLQAPIQIALILDGSNSMWAQIEGRSRIAIAKEVISSVIGDLHDEVQVAMRVYGHRVDFTEAEACQDSELVFPFGPVDKPRLLELVQSLQPRGTTPIAFSLRQVAGDFDGAPGEKIVLLVTDGIEECGGSPAEAVAALLEQGLDVRVNIVGFDLADDEAKAEMEQVAAISGGSFFDASDAGELLDALQRSLAVPFTIYDAEGSAMFTGNLGDDSVELPAGTYRAVVHMPGVELAVADVTVHPGHETTVELRAGVDGPEASVIGQ